VPAAAAAGEQPVGRVAVVMVMTVTLASAALAALALVLTLAVARVPFFAPAPLSGEAGAS
jgi:hypothetical protein